MEYREKFGLAALLTHLQFVSSASVSVHISATRLIMRLYCVLCSMLFIIIIIRGICINLFSSSGGDSLLIRVFHKVTTQKLSPRESVFTVLFQASLFVHFSPVAAAGGIEWVRVPRVNVPRIVRHTLRIVKETRQVLKGCSATV